MKSHENIYFYAIIQNNEKLLPKIPGITQSRLFLIQEREIAAVVSGINCSQIRPERCHLAAHQAVSRELIERTTPLSIAFGTIPDNEQIIKEFLTEHYDEFINQLEKVSGKVEFGLKAIWNSANIFEYFVHNDQELREARDRIFNNKICSPTIEEKVYLGKLFSQKIEKTRSGNTNLVKEILEKYCTEVKINECKKENDIMELSCMVLKNMQEDLKKGITEVAQLFDDNVTFSYNGPWSPHSFINLDINY